MDATSLKEYWSDLKNRCVSKSKARGIIQSAKTTSKIAKRRQRVALLKLLT
jgi:hypothetical protein